MKTLSVSPPLVCVLVYRPPQSMPAFSTLVGDILANLIVNHARIVILGDFNYWPDDPMENSQSKEFSDLLTHLNLTQLVELPTHTSGHILDQIWSANLDVSLLLVLPCL